ncbi:hypothetical protein, partial [Vibrio aestuarianus]|uniref:hypothetical protein n=1 Tax=Vibrio aestuarianus TaxID=28171 RepID=UPI003BA9D7BB
QPAENTEQIINEIVALTLKTHPTHNAALRGECRLNQASADHFHHQNSPHTKNATRHESLLNALL